MRLLIPSIYWPIAKLGFSGSKTNRALFRLIFSKFYRKRIWNPLINSWARQKGLDRSAYVIQNNIHSFASIILLLSILYWLYYSEYRTAITIAAIELIINVPAIILSRYLYLITLRQQK